MSSQLNRRQFVRDAAGGVAAAGLFAPTILRAAGADQWGDLVGRFSYEGDPPEREKLDVDNDLECCGAFDIRDESLMVGDDRGLENVYVYAISRRIDVCPELEEAVEEEVLLDNRDCIFMPHCMSIWHSKQKYHIVNSDPVGQTVKFDPLGDKKANMVLPVGADEWWTFGREQRAPVPVLCVVHKWESAYVLPRDNPYVAISAADGTFRIPKLPVGEVEFQVWQERIGYVAIERWPRGRFKMTIKPGTNDLGTVALKPAMFEQEQ